MLTYTNPHGYRFVWEAESDWIEVYHAELIFPEEPLWVISADGFKREIASLKRISNEDPEYSEF